jgi:hypothetical protein
MRLARGVSMRQLGFQVFAWVSVATLGFLTTSDIAADAIMPTPSLFLAGNVDRACLAAKIGVVRTDLKRDCALARSAQALDSSDLDQRTLNEQAQAAVIKTLSHAPHDSRLWLALALLQGKANQPNGEALRMSYITGPHSWALIRQRLTSAVASNVLAEEDLRELAAGDIRLIITRRPELKDAIVDAYKQASPIGKSFIEQRTSKLDSQFSASLPNSK